MICAINDKNRDALENFHVNGLITLMEQNKPLDLNDYLGSLYRRLLLPMKDGTVRENDYALSLIHISPGIMRQVIRADIDLENFLVDKGFNLSDLVKLDNLFTKSGTPLETVQSFVGQPKNVISELKTVKETVDKVLKQSGYTIQPNQPVFKNTFHASPSSPLTTSGQEATTVKDAAGQWVNIQDPAKITRYAFQRHLISQVISGIPGRYGDQLRLTAMYSSKITDYKGPDTMLFVVTDNDGNILSLDKDGKTDGKTEVMYYESRDVTRSGNTYSVKPDLSPLSSIIQEYADMGVTITTKEAESIRQKELKEAYDIQQYIKANPDNRLIFNIIGGSMGYTEFDYNIKTPLSEINFTDEPLKVIIQKGKNGPFQNGATYFRVKGLPKPVFIQRNEMSSEIINKIVTTILEPVYESHGGETYELTANERVDLIKQYLNNDPYNRFMINDDRGKIVLLLDQQPVDLTDPASRDKILNFFNTYAPTPGFNQKIVTNRQKETALKISDPNFSTKLYQGVIVEKADGTYTKYTKPAFNINSDFKDNSIFNNYTLETQPDGRLFLKSDMIPYYDWLKKNTYVNYSLNSDGKILALNSYFKYQLTDEAKDKLYPEAEVTKDTVPPYNISQQGFPGTQTPSEASKLFGEQIKNLGLTKLTGVKELDEKATEEQIQQALKWYNAHPLSKYLPFRQAFDIVNSDRIAQWTQSGIDLYHGADYSDLYHESWHGFSQGFLTRKEKIDLYHEVSQRSGSFLTHTGKRVTFKRANNLEIEEYLAEDFRKYMLSKGDHILKSSPVRNSLFRRILNFLKALFGDTTQSQMLINNQSTTIVRDLFEKLRVGNMNGYTFAASNSLFNVLKKGATSVDGRTELSSDQSLDVVTTIDSIFSTFIDDYNRTHTDRITNRVFTTKAGRTFAYNSVLTDLGKRRDIVDLQNQWQLAGESKDKKKSIYESLRKLTRLTDEQIDKFLGPQNKLTQLDIQRNLDTLNFMITNFGNTTSPKKSKDENGNPLGVVAYHNMKSEFLSFEDKFEIEDTNTPEAWAFKDGNELSVYERGKSNVWYLIKGLHKIDEKGNTINNRLGFPQLEDFTSVRRRLTKLLADSADRYEMFDRLEDNKDTYPYINQLLFKLGSPYDAENEATFRMWNSFFQTFNSYRIPLPTMLLDKQGTKYISKVGEAYGDEKVVQIRWNSLFRAGHTGDDKIVIKKTNTEPYLDINAALKKYPTVSHINLIQFFNDIGVPLDRSDELLKEIAENPDEYNRMGEYMRYRLVNLQKAKVTVNNLGDLFVKDVRSPSGYESNESNNYRQIARLQARYSNQFADQVQTPTGDTRSEYSLNSTNTAIAKAINGSIVYSQLADQYSYFDQGRNPWVAVSKRLASMYDSNGIRNDNRYILENINGMSLLLDSENTGIGTSSASADQFTKFILDFHLLIQRSMGENPRPGDKSTSPSTYCKYDSPYSKNSSLWMAHEHFRPEHAYDKEGRMTGSLWKKVYDSTLPYLIAEHTRVMKMRNLKPGAIENDYPDYVRNGKDFLAFENILSPTTKDILYGIKIPLNDFFNLNTQNSKALQRDISADFKKYFDTLFTQAESRFSEAGFITENMMKKFTAKDSPLKGLTPQQVTSTLLRSFEFNTWINNMETTIIHFGDVAQYKTAVEFHKRIAMFSSTGDIFASDPTTIEYINNKSYLYGRSLGFKNSFSDKLTAGIMEDPTMTSVYYSEIYQGIYNFLRQRSYNDETAKKIATRATRAYTKMNIGDAQGWVTFDSYRALKMSSDKWSDKQEALYQRIVQGDYIDPKIVLEYYPVAKYQYAGPLKTSSGLPVMGAHKYSLFPLIPTIVNNNPTLKAHHERMMRDGIDYSTLASGSKITTVTNQGVMDKFFSDTESRTYDDKPFTKNHVYLNFLKDQQNVSESYKENVTISTQMRKVIEDTFMENGVPVDIKMDLYSWKKLSEEEKLKMSPKYRLIIEYEKAINTLTEEKKKEFIKEIGWDTPSTYGTVTEKLLVTVDQELARQDLSDNEREIIQLKDPVTGTLLYGDLSYHLSSEKIEKILMSMLNRKLVRQKMLGEPLVQVSSLGFESPKYLEFRGKLTYEEQMKYGTNDLAYYRPGATTSAAKTKIAFMSSFHPLLQLTHRDGKLIESLERLNQSLKDEVWLNMGQHRRMITIVGPRVPVEGHNSMEFLEVYEFLPTEAGNIIVLPAEIVAKSGSDFDVDKVSMMMPHIRIRDGKPELFRNYTMKEARLVYEELKANTEDILKLSGEMGFRAGVAENRLLQSIFSSSQNLDRELKSIIANEGKLPTFEKFFEELNGTKTAENEYLWACKKLLEHKDTYPSLVTPNGTYTIDPIINGLYDESGNLVKEGIRDHVTDYDAKYRVHTQRGKSPSYSSLMEYGYNNYVHQINKVSGEALAIAAVDNTASAIFNRVGAHMSYEYFDRTRTARAGQGVTKRLALFGYDENEPNPANRFLYNHMKDEQGRDVISLSHLNDANNQLRISGNIEQMINLLLDITKNDSAYYAQLKKEVIPTLLFLNMAGVPIDYLITLASQPIIREYMNEIRLARSPIAGALNKAPDNKNFFKNKARSVMYQEVLGYSPNFNQRTANPSFNPRLNVTVIQNLYNDMNEMMDDNPDAFSKDRLYNKVISDDKTITDDDKAVLMHWFEIEDMANAVRDIKIHLNPDTKRSVSAILALSKSKRVEELMADERIPRHVVESILEDSAISSLASVSISRGDIPSFAIEFLKPLFPIRTDKRITDFLLSKMSDMRAMQNIEDTFGDAEKFTTAFFNDLMLSIFQNKLRDFDIGTITKFRNLNARKSTNVKQIPYLSYGAFVKNDTLYYDMERLIKDFSNREYTGEGYKKRGLATLPQTTFRTSKEFYNYVFEREYIRSYLTPSMITTDDHYMELKARNASKVTQKERIERISYEEYIRDKALDNIGNGNKLFESDWSFADQVIHAIDKYDLADKYPMLGSITMKTGDKKRTKNLQLLDTDFRDPLKVDVFHQALKELGDPSVTKVPNLDENLLLSELFHMFPMVAFLQSGLTTSGAYSFTRLVPKKEITEFTKGAVDKFLKDFRLSRMESFYARFIAENSRFSRYKDYVVEDTSRSRPVSAMEAGRIPLSLEENTIPVYDSFLGYNLYDPTGITLAKVNNTISQSFDNVFVYDLATTDKPFSSKTQGIFPQHKTTNQTLGIPTLVHYTRESVPKNQALTALIDTTLDDNKALIDQAIENLKVMRDSGYIPSFSLQGYGQRMLGLEADGITPILNIKGKPGLQTFLYLSKRLYEEFNYVNKNYDAQVTPETVETPQEVLSKGQPISDSEVREFIKRCIE